MQALGAVHTQPLVAPLALQQQRLAAHGAVHQEVVLDKVQHPIRHLQRRIDLQVPRVAGDALQGKEGAQKGLGKRVGTTLWQPLGPGEQRGCAVSCVQTGAKGPPTMPGRGSGTGLVSVYHCCVSRFTSL